MKATTVLFLLMPLLAGCKNVLNVYESKATPPIVVSPGTNGTFFLSRTISTNVAFVTGAVQRVDLPMVNTPSIAGDKATCILLVPADSIPGHPYFRRIALHYDNNGWLQGLKSGMQLILRFQRNGEFDGVQFP